MLPGYNIAKQNMSAIGSNSIRSLQQKFAESSGFEQALLWDHIPKENADLLKKKIEKLLPLPETKQERMLQLQETLFNAVWEQRKYTNRNSMTSIIYVFVTENETPLEAGEYSVHPVFRTKRCFSEEQERDCCMIFVDETGRTYQNWASYRNDNLLPSGYMVTPKKGVYTFNEKKNVELEVCVTPAGRLAGKILKSADRTSAVAGVCSAAVCVAGAATTMVAAPVVVGALAVGACVGVYSTIRSGLNLYDRRAHEQTISVTNSEARNSWLGVLAGSLTIGASGATKVLTTAAVAGTEVSMMTQVLVNGMNISSIVISGAGIGSGILDLIIKYKDDEKISAMDVVQLSASLILFTHAVNNFRLASSIIQDTRQGAVSSYRESLSNRQRKMFDKVSKETIRMKGTNQGQLEIVRGINEMPSKQYLNDLHKINKNLNKESVRPSFGDGKIVLNDKVPVDTGSLRNNIQHGIGPDQLSNVPRTIPASHTDNKNIARNPNGYNTSMPLPLQENFNSSDADINLQYESGLLGPFVAILANGAMMYLNDLVENILVNIRDGENFQEILNAYSKYFNEESFEYILKMVDNFIKTILKDIHRQLHIFIPAESVMYRIFDYILKNLRDFSLMNLIEKTKVIFEDIEEFYLKWKTFNPLNGCKKCEICPGFYSICRL